MSQVSEQDARWGYHIMVRGAGNKFIFNSDENKEKYINYIRRHLGVLNLRLWYIVIMGNHAHFIIKNEYVNIAEFFRIVNAGYAKYYRGSYGGAGNVFQRPYKVREINNKDDLKNLFWYLSFNPVKENLSKTPEEYKWSSFPTYMGREWEYSDIIDTEFVSKVFGANKKNSEHIYLSYMNRTTETNPELDFTVYDYAEEENKARRIIAKEMSILFKNNVDSIVISENSISAFFTKIKRDHRRKIVSDILRETKLPVRRVASICRCSHTTVNAVKQALGG